jgi:hypothetical protein
VSQRKIEIFSKIKKGENYRTDMGWAKDTVGNKNWITPDNRRFLTAGQFDIPYAV